MATFKVMTRYLWEMIARQNHSRAYQAFRLEVCLLVRYKIVFIAMTKNGIETKIPS